ncbi:MAG: hypothetical protein EPO52_05305 [Herbiconiux sp.]|uniref:virginiamycin B lyase family protein n=1 Tax=Herbiconiux sp. TaxID=1871186 RepID=UPI0012108CF0|nr:putative Ig domain-containing protein [Herbiconiux sp.]TAJ49203.1 MAG: hypothetical protein EPO52_05305 [Herbiconiux sp.]
MIRKKHLLAVPLVAALAFGGAAAAQAAPLVDTSFATLPAASHPVAVTSEGVENLSLYSANSDGTISEVREDGTVSTLFDFGLGAHPCAMITSHAGELWIVNSGTGTIVEANVYRRTYTSFPAPVGSECSITQAPGTFAPMYVVSSASDSVLEITDSGAVNPSFAVLAGGASPRSIDADSVGNLFTANSGDDTVSKITAAGVVTRAFASLTTAGGRVEPRAVATDPSTGDVIVAGYRSGTLSRISPSGVVSTIVELSGAAHPHSLATTSLGDILVAEEGTASVGMVAAGTGTTSVLIDRTDTDFIPTVVEDSRGIVFSADASTNELMRVGLGAEITTPPFTALTLTTGTPFSHQFTATGVDPITFESRGLPPGLTFDASTGLLSGTPTATGVYRSALFARNALRLDPLQISITVLPGVRPAPRF